ncbi:hypothetical protein MNB_SV-13-1018 [hydrothermal vent metagenome]|uniref:Uncharacterized protein n=1 Tax=hydrothermal vent metagenome TaxID=652676 RepID=A0A1W1BZ19_9ZZZZ
MPYALPNTIWERGKLENLCSEFSDTIEGWLMYCRASTAFYY